MSPKVWHFIYIKPWTHHMPVPDYLYDVTQHCLNMVTVDDYLHE